MNETPGMGGIGVIGIVAAEGCEGPLAALLRRLSRDSGMALVVAGATGGLPNGRAWHRVTEATPLGPRRAYVAEPGQGLVLAEGWLRPAGKEAIADRLLRSLARRQPAIGVVFGDRSTDGWRGLEALRGAGGFSFTNAASPLEEAADLALDPEEIAVRLRLLEKRLARPLTAQPAEVETLCELLREAGGAPDRYRGTWLWRRAARRMVLHGFPRFREYDRLLREDAEERRRLWQDIDSRPSCFEAHRALGPAGQTALLRQVRRLPAGDCLRLWVPGCGSGDDAYALAISLREVCETLRLDPPVRIFATDRGGAPLERAKAGLCPEGVALELSPERLSRFFVKAPGGYRVAPDLREWCIFGQQDVLADPPLSRIDVIYCGLPCARWRLPAQQQLSAHLHYALHPQGTLILGGAAGAPVWKGRFSPLDRRRLFAKRLDLEAPGEEGETGPHAARLRRQANRLLARRSPCAGLVVDSALRILYRRDGPAGVAGFPLARKDLQAWLGEVLRAAHSTGRPVRQVAREVPIAGRTCRLDVEIIPLKPAPYCLLVFEQARPQTANYGGRRKLLRLNREPAVSRRAFLSASEQKATAQEELRTANEELTACNEDLWTANEELEAARRELQWSNERLRARNEELVQVTNDLSNLFDSLDIAILMLGSDLRIRRYNPRAARLFHLQPGDANRPLHELQPEVLAPGLERFVRETIEGDGARERQVQDREGRWYAISVRPYRSAAQRVEGAVVTWVDITSLKQMEQAHRASEERYRKVSELTTDFAYAIRVHPDGKMTREWTTQAFDRITGYGPREIPAAGWESIVHPDDQARWRAYLDGVLAGTPGMIEYRIVGRSGAVRWVREHARAEREESGGAGAYWYGTIRDITARRRAEEELRQKEIQLRHAQKMEALGRLAGGVAHDFNNLLTAILGYSDLLLESLKPGEPRRQDVDQIRQAAQRAAALTGQLLAFGRRQLVQAQAIDLNASLSDLDKMLRRLIGEDIELRVLPAPEAAWICVDRSQMDQVVLNLVVNSCDAMPEGGRLTVQTSLLNRGPADFWVLLEVSDTGCGMDADTRAHLFEPFFTTKEKEKGTGLGLSTVYGIVQQCGGSIAVESEPGRGTTFRILLPRVEAPVQAAGAAPEAAAPRGSEHVLLVEDDAAVRGLARSVLQKSGYQVLEARDGREALRLAARCARPLDLLVTDVVMPGLGGRALAERLRPTCPAMKVLFISGYTDGHLDRQRVLEPGTAFLAKPFPPQALARKVRQVLDAPIS
jgi:PAS domain S-box-containing protein